MRWKILELAQRSASLDALLTELRKHPEYQLPDDGGFELLLEYSDILPENLRDELHSRASAADNPKPS